MCEMRIRQVIHKEAIVDLQCLELQVGQTSPNISFTEQL